jgi:hypothetical protein
MAAQAWWPRCLEPPPMTPVPMPTPRTTDPPVFLFACRLRQAGLEPTVSSASLMPQVFTCTPFTVVKGATIAFFSRTSRQSRPSSSAIMSISTSAAKRVWVTPWPRIAAPDGWLVKMRQASYLKFGIL